MVRRHGTTGAEPKLTRAGLFRSRVSALPESALWPAVRLARRCRVDRHGAHAGSDLRRNAVVAEHVTHVAKPTGLALHCEMPERGTGLGDQRSTPLPLCRGWRFTSQADVEPG